MSTREHVALIDGNNMVHRAWSVAPRERTDTGVEVGATLLFSKMLMKLLHRMDAGNVPPSAVVVFFDPPRDATWRRMISPLYKANRPEPDPDLVSQRPLMTDMCEAMGLRTGVSDTHEADDMIAAYVADARQAGMNVSIISSDKDLMQLVGKGVLQHNPASGAWLNAAKVEEKFGVPPERLADLLALTGDVGDGVKGVPGIGPKSAAKLLSEFETLDDLLSNTNLITRDTWRTSIETNIETIRLARRLVSLDAAGCPRPFSIEGCKGPRARPAGDGLDAWIEGKLREYVPPRDDPQP